MNKFWMAFFIAPPAWFAFHFAQNQWVYSKDTTDFFYVIKRWVWQRLVAGEVPLWNEGLYTGFYQMASPALAVFSPNNVLFFNLFSGIEAEQFQLPLFALLAAIGMFLFARNFLDAPAAALIGVSFALSGPLISLADRSHIFYTVALYPWFFHFTYRFTAKPRLLTGLGISFVLAMIVSHGDWVAAPILTKCAAIYWLSQRGRERVLHHLKFLWPHFLSIGIAAVCIFPVFENLAESSRAGGFTLAETSYYSFHPVRLFNLMLPKLFGQPFDGSFWGQKFANAYEAERFWFHSIFLGSPILILGALGLLSLSKRVRLFVAGAIAIFVLIAMGVYGGIHQVLFELLVPYRGLRFPEKFILYPLIAWVVLAVFGLREVIRNERWKILAFGIIGVNLIALCSSFAYPASDLLYSQIAHVLVAVAAAASLLNSCAKFRMQIFTALACFELLVFSPAMFWYPKSSFTDRSPFAEAIQGNTRIIRDGLLDLKSGANVRRTLMPDWHILDGISEVFGYETLQPPRIPSIKGAEILRNFPVWSRVLNVGYVATSLSPREKNLKELADQGLIEPVKIDQPANAVLVRWKKPTGSAEIFSQVKPVDSADVAREAVVARNADKEPAIIENFNLAFRGSNANAEWKLTSRSSNSREYEIRSEGEVFFVEREAYHPNWRALLDGQPIPVYRADYLSRGVFIPAGDHKLKMEFHAPIFWASAWVSVISASLFFMLLAFALLRREPSHS